MRTNFLLGICLLWLSVLQAQPKSLTVPEIRHYDPYFEANAYKIHRFILEKITREKRFILVERQSFAEIELEKERQKNEGFIDGVIAEQGRQLGALFLLNIAYDRDARTLQYDLLDLEKGLTICAFTHELGEYMTAYRLSDSFWGALSRDLDHCFENFAAQAAPALQLVEMLETKGGKAVKLLLYCEDNCRMQAKDRLRIYRILDKQLGEKQLNYEEVIGEIEVAEIENDHFFNALVTSGGKELHRLIQEKTALYAKF